MYPPCARCGYAIGGAYVATPKGIMHPECAAGPPPPPPPQRPQLGPTGVPETPWAWIGFFCALLVGLIIVASIVGARKQAEERARAEVAKQIEDARQRDQERARAEQREREEREAREREAAAKRRNAGSSGGGGVCCCDGTRSGCAVSGRGCCSHHGGICGC